SRAGAGDGPPRARAAGGAAAARAESPSPVSRRLGGKESLLSRAKPVRRIITGHRHDGRSTIVMDGPAPNVKQRQAGNSSTLLWVTDETPAQASGRADRAARDIGVPPPARGSIFRLAEFPPGIGGEVRDHDGLLRDFGIGPEIARGAPPRHPAIHRTRSLDYIVVLEGEIHLLLD